MKVSSSYTIILLYYTSMIYIHTYVYMYMQSPLYSCILAEYFKWFKIFAVKIYEPFIKKSDSIFFKLLMKAAKEYSADI